MNEDKEKKNQEYFENKIVVFLLFCYSFDFFTQANETNWNVSIMLPNYSAASAIWYA